MVYTKSELFNEELQKQARIFKALAHPARLAILQYLVQIKSCMTGNIADELPLSRTTVNQHLKELKDVDLIQGTTEGVKTNYCLNPQTLDYVKKLCEAFFSSLISDDICC